VANEHELVDYALDTLLINKGARKQQEVELRQEKDEGNSEDKDEGPQQEMNIIPSSSHMNMQIKVGRAVHAGVAGRATRSTLRVRTGQNRCFVLKNWIPI